MDECAQRCGMVYMTSKETIGILMERKTVDEMADS